MSTGQSTGPTRSSTVPGATGAEQSVLWVGGIACTTAVAWALFGSRWGAHLGIGPLFFTDALIVLGTVHCAVSHFSASHVSASPALSPRPDGRTFGAPHLLLWLCAAWAAVRLVAGWRFDMDALRDAVPYLYAVVGLVAAWSLGTSTAAGRARTATWIVVALGAHAAWVFASVVLGLDSGLPVTSLGLDLGIFSLRWDFDTPVVGLFAAWLLVRLIRGGRHQLLTVLALVLCGYTVIGTESRAGLIGSGMVLLLGVVATTCSPSVALRRKIAMVAALPILLTAMTAIIPQTHIGDRLAGTFGDAENDGSANAAGTTKARDRTWQFLLDYSFADTQRNLVGVGYGPDFLRETHAIMLLVGTDDGNKTEPRSPHNYWLGTLMRGGLVAVVLFGLLVLAVAVRIGRLINRLATDDLLFLACAIPTVLIVPATFGVILESPFGAVPFFWAVGLVLAWPVHRSTHTGTAVRATPSTGGALGCTT